MGTPCRHTGLHPFHTIFWFWAFQNNVFKPVFGENLSQLFQCYLSARAFLHRNLRLSSILFHKSASTLRFQSKYLAPLTHQLLDTISRNYSGISVHWGKASRFMQDYSAPNTWKFFPSFLVYAYYDSLTAWGIVETCSELPCSRAWILQKHTRC